MVPLKVPLRVDFAGGWLDVPRNAKDGAFIVNCAITPMVSLASWPYQQGAGLGGSAANAILHGLDGVASEINLGVGWQDPAVIHETGLCVWRSGPRPVLHVKRNPDMLSGRMALHWTGKSHNTPSHTDSKRNYEMIGGAGSYAARAVEQEWLPGLLQSIRWSYQAQQQEGMDPLPEIDNALAWKYCGGGWGGYALYLFATQSHRDSSGLIPIEPYMRHFA